VTVPPEKKGEGYPGGKRKRDRAWTAAVGMLTGWKKKKKGSKGKEKKDGACRVMLFRPLSATEKRKTRTKKKKRGKKKRKAKCSLRLPPECCARRTEKKKKKRREKKKKGKGGQRTLL